jgi:hypothetical protein
MKLLRTGVNKNVTGNEYVQCCPGKHTHIHGLIPKRLILFGFEFMLDEK